MAFSDPGPVTLITANTPIAALTLGPGSYVVSAKVQFNWAGDGSATASCELSVTDGGGTVILDSSAGTLLLPPSATTLPWHGFTTLPLGGGVTLACTGQGIDASNIKLSAIQVETLTPQP